jgi:rhodanese-related sulfurtransferase
VTMKRYLIVVGILLLALVGVFTIVSCNNGTEETTGYTDLTPAEAQNLIADNPDLIIIDVSPAYDQGHLPGAVSYPVGDGTLEAVIPTLDKDATYLVYCHVDSVAIQGALALVDAGFTNVYRLEGNYSGWVDAGYPIEQ